MYKTIFYGIVYGRRKELKSLIMYIALPITLIAVCLYLILFSEDVYRYPCQNPDNWNTDECEPPACEAMGLCTKYLLDIDVNDLLKYEEPTLGFSGVDPVISEKPSE